MGAAVTREHVLKTWPEEFQAVVDGAKTFDYRRNDRDFRVGDALVLHEWDHRTARDFPGVGGGTIRGAYTGRKLRARVSYMLQGQFGVPEGFAVLALQEVEVME